MSPVRLRLRELREAAGISQARLAELAGTRQGTISLHELGTSRRIDLDLLERLAKALDVDVVDLFEEEVASGRRRRKR